MSGLSDFQGRFQRAILAGDNAVLEEMTEGAHEKREVLLGLYRKGYVDRLARVLQGDHAQLHAYLGDERYNGLARAYIAANPARDRLARCYASNLPKFLAATKPYSEQAEIAELALLEKGLNDAYYAEDAPVLQLSDLAGIRPEFWAELQFKPHPSSSRLNLATNAAAIWAALKNKTKRPAAVGLQSPQCILIWREGDAPKFRVVSSEEAMMWDQTAAGAYFGMMCNELAAHDVNDSASARAATYLSSWINSGLLSSATCTK